MSGLSFRLTITVLGIMAVLGVSFNPLVSGLSFRRSKNVFNPLVSGLSFRLLAFQLPEKS